MRYEGLHKHILTTFYADSDISGALKSPCFSFTFLVNVFFSGYEKYLTGMYLHILNNVFKVTCHDQEEVSGHCLHAKEQAVVSNLLTLQPYKTKINSDWSNISTFYS
jgi:hypothetical protein